MDIPAVTAVGVAMAKAHGQATSKTETATLPSPEAITAMIASIIQETNEEGEVIDPYATPSPSQVRIKAYLLALNPQDALVLKHLKDTGAKFDLVLRAPTSDNIFELVPVYGDFLNEYFGLEIEE